MFQCVTPQTNPAGAVVPSHTLSCWINQIKVFFYNCNTDIRKIVKYVLLQLACENQPQFYKVVVIQVQNTWSDNKCTQLGSEYWNSLVHVLTSSLISLSRIQTIIQITIQIPVWYSNGVLKTRLNFIRHFISTHFNNHRAGNRGHWGSV